MKKTRKIISIMLCAIMLFCLALPCLAATPAEDAKLRFREDGSFRIMNFADIQDDVILSGMAKNFMRRTVRTYEPDLIVLTGDNISAVGTEVGCKLAIRQVMDTLNPLGVPVAIVFGNHDCEHCAKEVEMAVYNSYKCSIAYDEGDELYGCGTYNVPILASDGSDKVAFNLWMIDSNMYDSERGGYDYVHQDQIEWYRAKSEELKAANGGEPVPSIAFQHIIVKEIYDALEKVPEGTEGAVGSGDNCYVLPETARRGSVLGEPPCPPTYNGGEFEAMKEQGDVLAMVFGHDHVNDFIVPYEGIDLINTPTVGFHSYGNSETRGARVIDVFEDGSYETFTFNYHQFYGSNPFMLFILKIVEFFKDKF